MIDDPFLLRAVQVEPGLGLKGVKSDFTSNVHKQAGAFYYRPVLGLLTRLEYSLWDGAPMPYHAVSLLFHVGNSLLVFWLLSFLGFGPLLSFLSACLFAVNPVIVDDLLAATGGESMANFLLLASLALFLRGRWAPAWLMSLAAVFAKESNVMLPALLLICLAYQGRLKKEYLKVLSLLPVCALFLVMRGVYVEAPAIGLTAAAKFLVMSFPGSVLHYLWLLLVPLGLETWPRLPAPPAYWPLTLAAALAAAAGVFFMPVKRRAAAFCAAWFLLAIAPRVPAMILNQVLMDKWIALSSPPVFLAFLAFLAWLRDRYPRRLMVLPQLAAAAAVIFWSAAAHATVNLRGSDEKNYRWTVRGGPRLFANYRLGLIFLGEGRAPEAAQALEPLLRLAPDQPDPQNAFAMALWHSGRHVEAWAMMRGLEKRYPDNPAIQENAARMRALMEGGGR
ncbi:MAG: hypothetical protein A2081_01805 [Elusimicrobia bacterium GWC2_61_19]|nr:MAG: hypothetical protein A2081_01805 [Elusimicrobia bacterium GWC2_61_19]